MYSKCRWHPRPATDFHLYVVPTINCLKISRLREIQLIFHTWSGVFYQFSWRLISSLGSSPPTPKSLTFQPFSQFCSHSIIISREVSSLLSLRRPRQLSLASCDGYGLFSTDFDARLSAFCRHVCGRSWISEAAGKCLTWSNAPNVRSWLRLTLEACLTD